MAVEHEFELRYTRAYETDQANDDIALLSAAINGFCLKNKWLVLREQRGDDFNNQPLFEIWSFLLDDEALKSAKIQDYTAYGQFNDLLRSTNINVEIWSYSKELQKEYFGPNKKDEEFKDHMYTLWSALNAISAYMQYEPEAYAKSEDATNRFTKRWLKLALAMGVIDVDTYSKLSGKAGKKIKK